MGVSSPTGNGETRGREYAGQPGQPLALRPERAKANNASSVGWHVTGNKRAADGITDMRENLGTGKPMAATNHDTHNSRAADGDPVMGSKVDMKGKMNR